MQRLALALALTSGPGAAKDYAQVSALFAERCIVCHSGADAPLGLRLDTLNGGLIGSDGGPVIESGTRVDDRPHIGDKAEMRGLVLKDGSVRAERFRDR